MQLFMLDQLIPTLRQRGPEAGRFQPRKKRKTRKQEPELGKSRVEPARASCFAAFVSFVVVNPCLFFEAQAGTTDVVWRMWLPTSVHSPTRARASPKTIGSCNALVDFLNPTAGHDLIIRAMCGNASMDRFVQFGKLLAPEVSSGDCHPQVTGQCAGFVDVSQPAQAR